MWIFSVGDSRGKITKHQKKADAPPPPPPAITQQIRFGNPPPLLDLINRHNFMIFLLVNLFFTFVRFMIHLFLGQCSNWFNQSNESDHIHFGSLGDDHFSFILDNPLWCTTVPVTTFLGGRTRQRLSGCC